MIKIFLSAGLLLVGVSTNSFANSKDLPICEYRGFKSGEETEILDCYSGSKDDLKLVRYGQHVVGAGSKELTVAKECYQDAKKGRGPIPLIEGLKQVKAAMTALESQNACRVEAVDCSIGLTYANPGAENSYEFIAQHDAYIQVGAAPTYKYQSWPSHRTTHFYKPRLQNEEYASSPNASKDTFIGIGKDKYYGYRRPIELGQIEAPLKKAKEGLDYLVSVGICKPYQVPTCKIGWEPLWVQAEALGYTSKHLVVNGGNLVDGKLYPSISSTPEQLADIMTRTGLCAGTAVNVAK